MEERMMRTTEEESWALHHARLAVKGPVLDIIEKWFRRNGWFFEKSEPAPPKDWQQQMTTFRLQIIELEDANRHLAQVNDKLLADLRKARKPSYLDAALNEGDGVYRP